MSNSSVNGALGNEGVSRVVRGQGQSAAAGGRRPVEQQIQELSMRMDQMATWMEQLIRERQPMVNP